MLVAVIAAIIAIVALFVFAVSNLDGHAEGTEPPVYIACLVASIVLFCLWFVPIMGFFTVQPGQARVCILFGKYMGTVRDTGFFWANPFYSRSMGDQKGASDAVAQIAEAGDNPGKTAQAVASLVGNKATSTKISVRARTMNGDRLKVNDTMGNPIEIAPTSTTTAATWPCRPRPRCATLRACTPTTTWRTSPIPPTPSRCAPTSRRSPKRSRPSCPAAWPLPVSRWTTHA